MANDLLVRILGDTKGLERSFAQANTATAQFGRNVETVGGKADKATKSLRGFATGAATGFAGAIVATEVTQQLKAAVDVASNLAEQISKTNVVFGSSADEVKSWAETTASSIGIANDQALEAASTFGSMFDAAGRSSADAANLSTSVVKLAADLSSFNNTSVDDALTALRSGLSGEIEPLRRFQVFLTEAAVAAEAMAQSGKNSAKELTQGEKIMARWSLILKQTTKQQGDYARTSGSLANQQRNLAAQARDLQAALGTALVPAIKNVVAGLSDATEATVALMDGLKALGNIQVPPILIKLKLVDDSGRLGSVLGKLQGAFVEGAETQFPGLAFVNELLKILEDPPPPPDTAGAAKAFDSFFDSFMESLDKDLEKPIARASGKIKSFGEKGFRPLKNSIASLRLKAVGKELERLELGVERAQIDENLNNDVAALEALAAGLRKAIDAGLKVVKNSTLLAQTVAQIAATKRQIQEDADEAFLSTFTLNVEKARLTPSLNNDIKALEAYKTALQKLIAQGHNVAENERELVSVTIEIRDARRERAKNMLDAAQAALNKQQFAAIGLDAEGEERIPTGENLLKQFSALGVSLDAAGIKLGGKMKTRFAQIGKLLANSFKNITPEVASAIKAFFGEVRDLFDDETNKGPLTKNKALNANKFLEGLGLSPEMERELRGRLSSLNEFGQQASGTTRPTGSFNSATNQPITVNTTVNLDNEAVGRGVTRTQQRGKRRNPPAKRGPRSGI